MNDSTIVFLINDNVRAIKANYEDGVSPETFKTLDPTIAVDDLVVVQSSTRHCQTVVKVTEIDVDFDIDTTGNINWVVAKIDQTAFSSILEQEGEAIAEVRAAERARKKAELRKSVFDNQEDLVKSLRLASHDLNTPLVEPEAE